MSTQALIYALRDSLKRAHKVQMEQGPLAAEEMLEYIKRLWLHERPIQLHTQN